MHDPLYDEPPSRWELFKSAHGVTGKADVAFHVSERGSSVGAELLGGLFNFLSTLHLVIVNAELLSYAGLPRESAAVSIALVSALGTLILGLGANVPFVVTPGLGLGAYVVYHLLIHTGASFATVNACVFLAGAIMALASSLNRVDWCLSFVPRSVKVGLIVGLGMLLAFSGLQIAQLLALDPWTLVKARSPPASAAFVALAAVVLSAALVHARVPGALLGGVAFVAVCAALGGVGAEAAGAAAAAASTATKTGMSPLGPAPSSAAAAAAADADTQALQGGPHALTLLRLPWTRASAGAIVQGLSLSSPLGAGVLIAATAALALVAGSDLVSAGCGLERVCGLRTRRRTPMGTIDSGPSSRWLYLSPALATLAGAPLCLPPCVLAVESAAAPIRGARTGLAAVVTAGMLGLAAFAAPAFAGVPRLSSAPVFLLTGASMLGHCASLDWRPLSTALPAALTALLLAFTADAALALAVGLAAAALLWVATGRFLPPAAAEAGEAAAEEGGVREYPGSPLVLPLGAMPVVAEGMGGRRRHHHGHGHSHGQGHRRGGSSGGLDPMPAPLAASDLPANAVARAGVAVPTQAQAQTQAQGQGHGTGKGRSGDHLPADQQPLLPLRPLHPTLMGSANTGAGAGLGSARLGRTRPDEIADTAAAAAAGVAAAGYGTGGHYDSSYLSSTAGLGAGAGTGAGAGAGRGRGRTRPAGVGVGEEDEGNEYHVVDTSLSGDAYP